MAIVCDNCGKPEDQWAGRPCYLSTTGEHVVQKQKPILEGEPETLRDRLAVAIYARNSKPEWLPTVDGTPNAASYELADRVLVQLALEES